MSATPPFTEGDAVDAVYRQAAEATWHYGTVVDLRRAVLNADGMGELLEHLRDLVALHGVRGPIALVTWESTATGLLRAYASDARQLVSGVDVFLNTIDAERWLDAQLSAAPGARP